jgi:aminoglycoside phosphotransferase (APT) family kinase protein
MMPDAAARTALPDPAVLAWVEEVSGGRVLRVRAMDRWRPNFFVDVAGPRGETQLFLKGPRVPPRVEARSRMLSRYGTRREAVALAALQDTGVAVPAFHGFHPAAATMLIGRVGGTGVLQRAPEACRAGLMRQYARQLATTHALDPDALGLRPGLGVDDDVPGPDRPGPLAAVLADYESHQARHGGPDPLVDLALWWLRRNVPAPLPPCVLHGDAGPNQFMFDGDRLTALVDWELAHLGHPMSDLGYARFRESLYPSGGFAAFLAEYAAATGRPVDRAAVDYFTVAAGLVMLAGISPDVRRPNPRNPEALQRFWWDALARVAICQVLGESLGSPPLRTAAADEDEPEGELTTLATLLAARLDNGSGARDAALLARALRHASTPAPDLECAVDAAELLGRVVADRGERDRALAEVVAAGAADRFGELVGHLGRQAVRRLDAMGPLAATDTWDRPDSGDADRVAPRRAGDPLLPPFDG